MGLDIIHPGPARLTAEDEASNHKELLDKLANGSLEDWPNEAGFDNLDEHRGPIELKVQGEIPAWAAGSLYRTGPGMCKIDDTPSGTFRFSHWFDGLAHTHRFEIVAVSPLQGTDADNDASHSRVFYSSRRQSEESAETIRKEGTFRSMSFGQKADPCVGMFSKIMTSFRRDPEEHRNICVTVNPELPINIKSSSPANKTKKNGVNGGTAGKYEELGHRASAKRIYLGTDTAMFAEVDPATLEPIGFVNQTDLHPDLKGPGSAAHGKRDPRTGDFFNFNMEYTNPATYRVFQLVAATGEVKILAKIAKKGVRAAYMHSIFLTESYVILCVPSVSYNWAGAEILWKRNLLESMTFDPEQPCRWLVVDRKGGKGLVAEFQTPPGFFFHSTNSFEEDGGDTLVCEVVEYGNADIMKGFYYDVLMNRHGEGERYWRDKAAKPESLARLARYRFPLGRVLRGDKKVEKELVRASLRIMPPHAGEMPIFNPAYALRRHRYVYMVASRGLSTLFDCIVKTDTETREVLMWEGPAGHTPGEAIFVPRPVGEGDEMREDDGVLLSVVLNGAEGKSYLLCLDARTMMELGRAECGFAVAFGFHGRHARA